jgi:predicted ester cyclase
VGAEHNKAVMRRIIEEVLNHKHLAAVDELFHQKYRLHPSTSAHPWGPEKARRNFSRIHKAFPDLRATLESIVAEGDMVTIRLTLSGTHLPTGRYAQWPVAVFTRFAEGKVVKTGWWSTPDNSRNSSEEARTC